MRELFFILSLIGAHAAHAESSVIGIGKSEIRVEHAEALGRFHWSITHRCQTEDNEEIETTPGSPPLDVDDPATPGCNNWEINVVADGDLTRDQNSYHLPLLDMNYGVGDNLQLKYEVPNQVVNGGDSPGGGVGDSKVGAKFQFFGDDETKLQLAIYPQMQFPSNAKGTANGRSTPGSITTLPLLFAKKLGRMARGDVMMSANLGYNISSKADTANFTSASVGVGAPLFMRASLMAELATEQATATIGSNPREHLTRADIGVIGPLGKYVMLFGAVGHSLAASDSLAHTYITSGVRVLPKF